MPAPATLLRGRRDADPPAPVLPTIEHRGYRGARRLVLGTVIALVTVRLFTEVVPVLPRFGNFIDVPLVGALAAYAAFALPRVPGERRLRPAYLLPLALFPLIWAVSATVNLHRVEPLPAFVFLYNFLSPLLVFVLAHRLWAPGQALAASRTWVALGVLQFAVIVVIQLPRFGRLTNPDEISGTFGENAYQLVFFLLVFGALVAGIATFEPRRIAARLAIPLLGGTFLVIFLAQYRQLLITTILTGIVVAVLLGSVRARGVLIGIVLVVGVFVAFKFVSERFPLLRFDRAVQTLQEDRGLLAEGKLAAARDVARLYAENAAYPLIGTGPGSYSSRAWRTFALIGTRGVPSDVAGGYVSALLGGAAYQTDVADRYVVPRVGNIDILGSRTLAAPFSSYLALLAEVGVPGFLVIVLAYVAAFARAGRMTLASFRSAPTGDPLPALLLAATVAFFVLLQASVLDNWLEGTRTTLPAWILLAIATKEYAARGPARPVPVDA